MRESSPAATVLAVVPTVTEMVGVVPPEETMGAVPETEVTWAVFETLPRPTSDGVWVWLPRATCVLLVPVGMRAMSSVPETIAEAA